MTKKELTYIIILILVIVLSVFGFFYFRKSLLELRRSNINLTNELDELKLKQKETHLIYTILRKSDFNQELYNSSLISLAVLLNDKEICNETTGGDFYLCKNIFEDKCYTYKYPNQEICENFRSMLNREITPDDLIIKCNDKNLMVDDLAQIQCFQYFARITDNIRLCDEICKHPINNTNCVAYARDKNNDLKLNKEVEIQACKDGVFGN